MNYRFVEGIDTNVSSAISALHFRLDFVLRCIGRSSEMTFNST